MLDERRAQHNSRSVFLTCFQFSCLPQFAHFPLNFLMHSVEVSAWSEGLDQLSEQQGGVAKLMDL